MPFGSLCHFYPSGTDKRTYAKADGRARDGIFLGYVIKGNCKIDGQGAFLHSEDLGNMTFARDIAATTAIETERFLSLTIR